MGINTISQKWLKSRVFALFGAGSIQITTTVMEYGYRIIDDLKKGCSILEHPLKTNVKSIIVAKYTFA